MGKIDDTVSRGEHVNIMTAEIIKLVRINYQGAPAKIQQERDYDTGKIVARTRVARSTIDIMASNGKITSKQAQAAQDFQATFERSCFQPRYAKVNFNRVQCAVREFSAQELDAAKQIEKIIEAIDPELRELAWYVIGFGEKLSRYCWRRGNMDQPLSYDKARRLLLKALDDLVVYYGY